MPVQLDEYGSMEFVVGGVETKVDMFSAFCFLSGYEHRNGSAREDFEKVGYWIKLADEIVAAGLLPKCGPGGANLFHEVVIGEYLKKKDGQRSCSTHELPSLGLARSA